MSANVLDFVERARLAAEKTADRVHSEQTRDLRREDYEQRRERIKSIGLVDEDRRLLISNTCDEQRFLPLRAVRSWLAKPVPTLMLGGTTGRGKTIACVDAIASRGGEFIEAPDLAALWSSRLVADHAQRQRLRTTPILVIDDVGTELARDRAVVSTALVQLLNARSTTRHRTLMTFNGDHVEFRKLYADERLHSRMDSPRVAWLVDVGPDMRVNPRART